jgi:diketogulonate reductase-like aldo/keto reductase
MPRITSADEINPGRRDAIKVMGLGLAAGAALAGPALHSQPAIAQAATKLPSAPSEPLTTRALPKSGDVVPAIGLGTFLTFDQLPGANRAALGEVIAAYWAGGARIVDTSPLYGTAEYTVGAFAAAQEITDELIVSNKVWSTGEFVGDDSHAARSLQQSQNRLWRERIDIMHCHSLTNVDVIVNLLRAWKAEGRIRYVGITHHENMYHDALSSWIDRGVVDFVQVNYSIFNRNAEKSVLPAAAARGVGVLVNMPLEKARLHKVVAGRSLPSFAKDFGAETWSQFFLKWVISNPVVTCALPSTSNPAHARENIAALTGPLPDEPMRQRMVAHMETIPGFNEIARMPWYPDKTYNGTIRRAQAAIQART